jgi:hypothetical protein
MKKTGITNKRSTALSAGDKRAQGFQDFVCMHSHRVERTINKRGSSPN